MGWSNETAETRRCSGTGPHAASAGLSPDPAPTGPVAACMTKNFPSYDPSNREQCIAACIKCENGVTTTCATACSLKAKR
jgi:hypothetical protein